MSHITGGGLLENLPRMWSAHSDLAALIDVDGWQRPAVFSWLQQAGNIAELEMLRTFNCGCGFVVCVDPADTDAALASLNASGETASVIGTLVSAGAQAASGQILIS
jgi:phosphoribosylformylglycinamidine cyclo-ligase